MIFRKFKEAFDHLPVMEIGGKDYKPYFDFGSQDDLVKRLTAYRQNQSVRIYPLIWLVTPIEESRETSATFILATINNRTEMGNFDRLKYTFEPTLEPLFTNVIKAIKQSRTFKLIDFDHKNYRGTKHFDYHIEPEIWDAIEFEVDILYNRDCPVKTKMNF